MNNMLRLLLIAILCGFLVESFAESLTFEDFKELFEGTQKSFLGEGYPLQEKTGDDMNHDLGFEDLAELFEKTKEKPLKEPSTQREETAKILKPEDLAELFEGFQRKTQNTSLIIRDETINVKSDSLEFRDLVELFEMGYTYTSGNNGIKNFESHTDNIPWISETLGKHTEDFEKEIKEREKGSEDSKGLATDIRQSNSTGEMLSFTNLDNPSKNESRKEDRESVSEKWQPIAENENKEKTPLSINAMPQGVEDVANSSDASDFSDSGEKKLTRIDNDKKQVELSGELKEKSETNHSERVDKFGTDKNEMNVESVTEMENISEVHPSVIDASKSVVGNSSTSDETNKIKTLGENVSASAAAKGQTKEDMRRDSETDGGDVLNSVRFSGVNIESDGADSNSGVADIENSKSSESIPDKDETQHPDFGEDLSGKSGRSNEKTSRDSEVSIDLTQNAGTEDLGSNVTFDTGKTKVCSVQNEIKFSDLLSSSIGSRLTDRERRRLNRQKRKTEL